MLNRLIRFALFGGEPPFPDGRPLADDAWQALFDESRRQAVTALLYDAILLLPGELRPGRPVLFHFTSFAQTVAQDGRRRLAALSRLAALLHDDLGACPVVVKGFALACRYPHPLHRECGDVDLLGGVDTERICALVESLGVAVRRSDPRHATFRLDGVTFECHRYLLYHNDDPCWEPVPFDRAPVAHLMRLPLEQEAFFLAKHAEHHAVFFHSRVRLRTLVDWVLLLRSDGFDHRRFDNLKRGTDVDRFADLMTLWCNRLFALDLPCDTEGLAARGIVVDDFDRLYLHNPDRHRWAVVRFLRRSWKYLRYRRTYRAIYGQSMFHRFYLKNVRQALAQRMKWAW